MNITEENFNFLIPGYLSDLRQRVENIENQIDAKYDNISIRETKDENNKERIHFLNSNQNQLIKLHSTDEKTITVFKSLFNEIPNKWMNKINDEESIFMDLHSSNIDGLLKILKYYKIIMSESKNNKKGTLYIPKVKMECFVTILRQFFVNHDEIETSIKLKFDDGVLEIPGKFCFDPFRKSRWITLSNNNRIAKLSCVEGFQHSSVLMTKRSIGKHCWLIQVNDLCSTNNWISIGVTELSNNYGDLQNLSQSINIRGGGYETNQMNPKNHSIINNGDIITCTLDFENDSFEIRGHKDSFVLKSTKSIKGLILYPFVELYYNNSQVTLISDE
jgi:hypothetical protein